MNHRLDLILKLWLFLSWRRKLFNSFIPTRLVNVLIHSLGKTHSELGMDRVSSVSTYQRTSWKKEREKDGWMSSGIKWEGTDRQSDIWNSETLEWWSWWWQQDEVLPWYCSTVQMFEGGKIQIWLLLFHSITLELFFQKKKHFQNCSQPVVKLSVGIETRNKNNCQEFETLFTKKKTLNCR